jgi:hypothetical protein
MGGMINLFIIFEAVFSKRVILQPRYMSVLAMELSVE